MIALLLALAAIVANTNPAHPYGDFLDHFAEGHSAGLVWVWPSTPGDDWSYAGMKHGLLVTGP